MGVVAVTPSTFPSSQWCCCCCCCCGGGCEVRAPRLSLPKGHCFLSAERITVLWSSSLNMPRSTMRQTQVRLHLVRWISHYCRGSAHTHTYSALDVHTFKTTVSWTTEKLCIPPSNTHLWLFFWRLKRNSQKTCITFWCLIFVSVHIVYLLFFYLLIKLPLAQKVPLHVPRVSVFPRRSHAVILTSWPPSHNSAVLFPLLLDCNSKFFCFL